MDTKLIETKIITAYSKSNFDEIQSTYIDLLNNRAKMDRWFNKYLDMFDEKLSSCDRNDPVKKMYDKKFDEYERLGRVIKIAEHYMNRTQHV